MNILLPSMPDSFEHTPALTMRMPNGALASHDGDTWTYEEDAPMATYLATVVIGQLTFTSAAGPLVAGPPGGSTNEAVIVPSLARATSVGRARRLQRDCGRLSRLGARAAGDEPLPYRPAGR